MTTTLRLIPDPKSILFAGHARWVRSIAFSPDGALVASGSYDEKIKIWNVETGACVRMFEHTRTEVFCIAFSSDAQFLAFDNFQKPEGWSKENETPKKRFSFSVLDFGRPNLGRVHPLEARFAAL